MHDLHHLGHVAGGLLNGRDVGMLGKPCNGLGLQVAAGAAGDVVQDHGHGGSVGNGGEVLVKAVLSGLVVVGGHHQNGVRAHFAGGLGVGKNVLGVVGAGAGDDGNPLCHLLYGVGDDLLLIFRLDGGVLAGGAHDHQGVDAVFNLEFDEATQGFVVNGAVRGHGGDNGGSHTGENCVLHILISPRV